MAPVSETNKPTWPVLPPVPSEDPASSDPVCTAPPTPGSTEPPDPLGTDPLSHASTSMPPPADTGGVLPGGRDAPSPAGTIEPLSGASAAPHNSYNGQKMASVSECASAADALPAARVGSARSTERDDSQQRLESDRTRGLERDNQEELPSACTRPKSPSGTSLFGMQAQHVAGHESLQGPQGAPKRLEGASNDLLSHQRPSQTANVVARTCSLPSSGCNGTLLLRRPCPPVPLFHEDSPRDSGPIEHAADPEDRIQENEAGHCERGSNFEASSDPGRSNDPPLKLEEPPVGTRLVNLDAEACRQSRSEACNIPHQAPDPRHSDRMSPVQPSPVPHIEQARTVEDLRPLRPSEQHEIDEMGHQLGMHERLKTFSRGRSPPSPRLERQTKSMRRYDASQPGNNALYQHDGGMHGTQASAIEAPLLAPIPEPADPIQYFPETARLPPSPARYFEHSSQQFFQKGADKRTYDVIVVGSGIGGGILANALAKKGARTLVLEAGGCLLPVHVSNMTQRQQCDTFGEISRGLWNSCPNQGIRNQRYNNIGENSAYAGGSGYNLGGRSLFWSGFAPRMEHYEFQKNVWPKLVRDDLLNEDYYENAEALMRVGPALPTEYQVLSRLVLAEILNETIFCVRNAPVSGQRPSVGVITDTFSTADLLLNNHGISISGPLQNQHLHVILNQDVQRLHMDKNRVTCVESFDTRTSQLRYLRGRKVVLAAGALESPRIAQRSDMGSTCQSGFLGRGITDHQVWFVHFLLPRRSRLFREKEWAILLFQHLETSVPSRQWIGSLELGVNHNRGRYVNAKTMCKYDAKRESGLLCELVFSTLTPLLNQNIVCPGNLQGGRPIEVHVEKSHNSDHKVRDFEYLTRCITETLQAEPLWDETTGLHLVEADLGSTSHEVGACRMSESPSTGFVDDNLLVHGSENLYVCDLSVFPNSPAADPTLTLAALALRLTEEIVR